MNCPNCNTELREGVLYCPHCGTRILPEGTTDLDKTTEALHVLSDADFAKEEPVTAPEPEPAMEEPAAPKETEPAKEETKPEEAPVKPSRTVLDPPEEDDGNRLPKHPKNPKAKYIYFSNEDDLVIPASYQPLSGWGFFGYSLLFVIPVIGWITALVFAFNKHNLARRGFARMTLIWLIITALTVFCLVYFKAPVIQPLVEWVLQIWPF